MLTMDYIIFWNFILATALGALIGTEREMPRTGVKMGWAAGFGGIRSYALLSLLGAIATWMDISMNTNIWKISGLIISGLFVAIAYTYSSFSKDRMGVTSEYSALLTYFIGVIAMSGQATIAVMLAILILIVLSSKDYLSKLKERFSREELGDSLKFAVIALVILPLLPDAKFSIMDMAHWFYHQPLGWTNTIVTAPFFNPYGIWFFVVIMAGVEYAGFILSRVIGSKWGIMASGAIGGLISSTATTVAMTKKSTEHPENRNSYIVGTLVASCIMFIRVIVVAGIIYPTILTSIWIPATVMFVGLSGTALYYYLQSRKEPTAPVDENEEKEYESPFQLWPAIQFAGLIVIIKFLSIVGKAMENIIPPEVSNYGLAIISGLADVDAINMTYSGNAKAGLISTVIAATTILIAVMSNNVVKASIAYRFGEKEYGKRVFMGFWISILLGIIAIIALNFVSIVEAFGK